MREVWKQIRGFEGKYDVSNMGRVRSLRFINAYRNDLRKPPLILSRKRINDKGYPAANLRKNNRCFESPFHVLVAEAFIGKKPKGKEVAHLDGNKLNAKASNLMWATRKENESHKRIHGTHQDGELNHYHKLKETQVKQIILLSRSGRSRISLANVFGVHRVTIGMIARRRTWKHIKI